MDHDTKKPFASNKYTDSVETSLTMVGLREDGILEIRFKFDEYEVDLPQQQEIHDAVFHLTKKGMVMYHILVVPGKYGGITKEAREMEMFLKPAFKEQFSLAIVVHSLAQRIIGNMFLKMKTNKPKFPSRLFTSEELALKWINKLK